MTKEEAQKRAKELCEALEKNWDENARLGKELSNLLKQFPDLDC